VDPIGRVAQAEYPDSVYIVRTPGSEVLLGDLLKVRDRVSGLEYLVRVYNAHHGLTSISERLAAQASRLPELLKALKPEDFYDVYVASPLCTLVPEGPGRRRAAAVKSLPTQFSEVYLPDPEDFRFLAELEGFDLPIGTLRARTTGGEGSLPVSLKGLYLPRHVEVAAITGRGKTNAVLVVLLSMLRAEIGRYSALVFDAHDEYYWGSGAYGKRLQGLRSVELAFPRKVHYYDFLKPGTAKVSPLKLAPEDVENILELSIVQYEACYAFSHFYGDRWIFEVIDLADRWRRAEDPKERGRILLPGVQSSTLMALTRKLRFLLRSRVLYESPRAPERDLISEVLERLDEGSVVIVNTKNISDFEEAMVMNVLARNLLRERSRLSSDDLRRRPITLIVLEEALSVLSQEALKRGVNIFARIVREGRKFNIGLLSVVQRPRRLDPDVASQINTYIVLGTAQKSDRAALTEGAQQDLDVLINEMKRLDVGEALIAFPAEVPFPLPVKIYHFNEYAERALTEQKSSIMNLGEREPKLRDEK